MYKHANRKIEKEEKKIPDLPNVGFNSIDSSDFRYAVEPSRCEKIEEMFEHNENLIDYHQNIFGL